MADTTWIDEQEAYEDYVIWNFNYNEDEYTDVADCEELAFYLASDDEDLIAWRKAFFYNAPCW